MNSLYSKIYSVLNNLNDRKILHYYGKDIDNVEFLSRIDSMAYYLNSIGIKKGDAVAICLPNVPSAVIAVYAINKCGAIANLIHPLTPALSIKRIVDETNSKLLFYLDIFYIKGIKILSEIKTVIVNVSEDMAFPIREVAKYKTRKARKDSLSCNNTIALSECYSLRGEVKTEVDAEDTAVYLHSGGTAGEPKTIMLSNRCINSCAELTGELVEEVEGNSDAMLMVLPLFHGFGLAVAMHATICKGSKVVLVPRFTGKYAVKLMKKQPITIIAGVPQMYVKMMDTKGFSGRHLRKLKYMFSGGDKLSKGIKDRWDNYLKQWGNDNELLEGYGLTEMVTVTHVNRKGSMKSDSVGQPLRGIEHKIVDIDNNSLPKNSCGEICLTGPTLMQGYLNDKNATDKVLVTDLEHKKWLHTGDLGYIDSDGHLFFKERIKRMIKVSGINVYPQEIECLAAELDEVNCACALEMDYHGRSAIKLYIVLNDGYCMTSKLTDKISNYIKDRLMKYSVPKAYEFRKTLPLTMVGKVDYRALELEEKSKGRLKE